ncbi:MAG: TIGR00269 family protein [Candidatus Aenigmatarchaeota archaeon]|nr:TIGR00269 family protein [Candidatus Aenigmarchaeota archaeon]
MKKCSSCSNQAIYFRINEGRYYCKRCFSKNIENRVKTTIRRFKMIEDGDKIAVGLSGGKDSSNTLYILKKIFEKNPKIEIVAITIDEGIKGYRDKTLKGCIDFCKHLGVEHHIVSFQQSLHTTIDKIAKELKEGSMCGPCGIFRRYLLNQKARELNANKIAVGHNLDDEAQSILMNVMKGDLLRLARFGGVPKVVDHKKFIPRIKPLLMIPEKESALYAMINGIPAYFDECPYANFNALRMETRDFLNKLEDRSPGIKYSIVKSGEKIASSIKHDFAGKEINVCERCEEPSSEKICRTCKTIEKYVYNSSYKSFKSRDKS